MASAGKWFADEKEDTGLQTAENSKYFGIASLIESLMRSVPRCFLSYEAETDRYAPQSGEFIGHCHDQEKAQVHQDAQNESKQMPAEAESTDPGRDTVS